MEVSNDGVTWQVPLCDWTITQKGRYYHYSTAMNVTCGATHSVRFRSPRGHDAPFKVFEISLTDHYCVFGEIDTSKLPSTAFNSASEFRSALSRDQVQMTERLSAILLNWKRICNLRYIVRNLVAYPFIGEVIIWNNNVNQSMSDEIFFPEGKPRDLDFSMRILNTRNNTHDFAKYTACSMAKLSYCYLQDDDWVNTYLASQYVHFTRHPQHIHSYTIPMIHLEQQRWRLYNKEAGLHAGFTWLGLGSIMPKTLAVSFLYKISQLGTPVLQVDMLFAYFSNNFPYQLFMRGHALDQTGAWSGTVDHWKILYSTLV